MQGGSSGETDESKMKRTGERRLDDEGGVFCVCFSSYYCCSIVGGNHAASVYTGELSLFYMGFAV